MAVLGTAFHLHPYTESPYVNKIVRPLYGLRDAEGFSLRQLQ